MQIFAIVSNKLNCLQNQTRKLWCIFHPLCLFLVRIDNSFFDVDSRHFQKFICQFLIDFPNIDYEIRIIANTCFYQSSVIIHLCYHFCLVACWVSLNLKEKRLKILRRNTFPVNILFHCFCFASITYHQIANKMIRYFAAVCWIHTTEKKFSLIFPPPATEANLCQFINTFEAFELVYSKWNPLRKISITNSNSLLIVKRIHLILFAA